jgi:hypothetical protein
LFDADLSEDDAEDDQGLFDEWSGKVISAGAIHGSSRAQARRDRRSSGGSVPARWHPFPPRSVEMLFAMSHAISGDLRKSRLPGELNGSSSPTSAGTGLCREHMTYPTVFGSRVGIELYGRACGRAIGEGLRHGDCS